MSSKNDTSSAIGLKAIRTLDKIVDNILLVALVIVLLFSVYIVYDNRQTVQTASASSFEQYRPSEEESFAGLVSENDEVFGWVSVYGTGIDYPIAQGENNYKYVSTDVRNKPSLAGSIFLDAKNDRAFTDFNSIIYGHHMAESAMFGDIDKFGATEYLEEHAYGELYTAVTDTYYGVEFFAYVMGDAYDWKLYDPAIAGEAEAQAYVDYLDSIAVASRDVDVSASDRIVLLSTCASEPTNGRHVIVGKLTDERFENTFGTERADQSGLARIDALSNVLLIVVSLIVIVLASVLVYVLKRRKDAITAP